MVTHFFPESGNFYSPRVYESAKVTAPWPKYSYKHCYYLVTKLCLTLHDPVDCSLPDSSLHGIPRARILEWVAISFSRGSSRPKDQTHIFCIGKKVYYHWTTRETLFECCLKQLCSQKETHKLHWALVVQVPELKLIWTKPLWSYWLGFFYLFLYWHSYI